MNLSHHQTYLVEEFAEEYHERRLSRRELLRRAVLITGSIPLAASALIALGCGSGPDNEDAVSGPTLAPTSAAAVNATVPANDPGVIAQDVRFAGPASEIQAYLARPSSGSSLPAVIVIHENRGLPEHFKDVARRYAKEGFVALAVDLVSRNGGTKPETPNENMGSLARSTSTDLVADLMASVEHLKSLPYVKRTALGVSGFCFGGNYTWELAIASAEMKAAVPYYGTVRSIEDLAKTQAAVLAMYGANDTRVTGQSAQVEQQLRSSGKTAEIKVYPGAGHAFFNDTGGAYNAEAAADAWQQTIGWFRRYLV